MKELEQINNFVEGGLLTKEDAEVALRLFFGVNRKHNLTFTDKELFKIYVDIKCRKNYAPEELEDFEVELANKITNKIENHIQGD